MHCIRGPVAAGGSPAPGRGIIDAQLRPGVACERRRSALPGILQPRRTIYSALREASGKSSGRDRLDSLLSGGPDPTTPEHAGRGDTPMYQKSDIRTGMFMVKDCIAASSEAGQMAASDYVPIFFKNRLHLAGRPQMGTRPSVPLVLTFAHEVSARGCERQNRDTSALDLTFVPVLPRVLRTNVKSKSALASLSC